MFFVCLFFSLSWEEDKARCQTTCMASRFPICIPAGFRARISPCCMQRGGSGFWAPPWSFCWPYTALGGHWPRPHVPLERCYEAFIPEGFPTCDVAAVRFHLAPRVCSFQHRHERGDTRVGCESDHFGDGPKWYSWHHCCWSKHTCVEVYLIKELIFSSQCCNISWHAEAMHR